MKHNQAFEDICEKARGQIREISILEAKSKLDRGEKFHFIDVREDHEWAAGHAAGATHLGRGIIERDIHTRVVNPDEEIVLYCGGGYRSALAAVNLKEMGYSNVFSLAGGIRAWRDAGFPEEKPA